MVDVKWRNGETVTDDTGNVVRIGGRDALFQRTLLRLTVPKGSFIYDRELGVRRGGADMRRSPAPMWARSVTAFAPRPASGT